MTTISSHVIGLMSLLDVQGNNVKIPQQLGRPNYVALDKVLQACGGKWNKSAKAHVFDADPSDVLDAAMLTGEYADRKKDFDQFDSPPDVIEKVIYNARLSAGLAVLEPSAGVGLLATEAAQTGALVDVYEIDPGRIEILRNNPAIQNVWEMDFLESAPNRVYDRVVMNPPFSRQLDIDHVNHALKFLVPGGRLVAVMSAGVLFRDNLKTVKFRDHVIEQGGMFEQLPDGAFKASGTMVRSVVVTIDR